MAKFSPNKTKSFCQVEISAVSFLVVSFQSSVCVYSLIYGRTLAISLILAVISLAALRIPEFKATGFNPEVTDLIP